MSLADSRILNDSKTNEVESIPDPRWTDAFGSIEKLKL